jgi:Ser/Thr protein kinase RdoA (MazF antagonist)
MDVASILEAGWGLHGDLSTLGAGHIHDTYLVAEGTSRWVLQRINRQVFVDADGLMDNVQRVVSHISNRAPGFVAELKMTLSGTWFHVGDAGSCWRLSDFVADTHTLQSLENTAQAQSAGRAFARYQNLLVDLPKPELIDPIAGFMRLHRYLAEYDKLATANDVWRDFVAERASLQHVLQSADDYVHGDCKVNNLLFIDGSDEVGCIVDLDTTMRGHWAWDFGDLVRSGAVRDGGLSVNLFAALAEGFVGEKRSRIVSRDLVIAPRYVCFMLGVRFLTDHLNGDHYFKVSAPGENLTRAERQFRLLEEMEVAEPEMLRLVAGYD